MKKEILFIFLAVFINGCGKKSDNNIDSKGQDGGGGTSIASEFSLFGEKGLELISKMNEDLNLDVDEITKRTKILSVNEPICIEKDDRCYEAHYFKSKDEIHFDSNNWGNLSCNEKLALSSHEYLRSEDLEDANYSYSKMFLNANPTLVNLISSFCITSQSRVIEIKSPNGLFSYDRITLNFDGTVFISNPKVYAQGDYYTISANLYNGNTAASIACLIFGFSRVNSGADVGLSGYTAQGEKITLAYLGFTDEKGPFLVNVKEYTTSAGTGKAFLEGLKCDRPTVD